MKKFLKIKSLNKNKGPALRNSKGLTLSGVEGFTIIEIMISIAVFLIVISIGINSLLNIYFTISNTKKVRALIDSLSFTMEEMSRNIRVGYDYACVGSNDEDPGVGNSISCPTGGGALYFTEAVTSSRWGYRIYTDNNGDTFEVQKKENNGEWFTLIGDVEIGNGMNIKQNSGFVVFGAENGNLGDSQQPLVIIKLIGDITYKSTVTPFSLQTSVSQMYPDTPE